MPGRVSRGVFTHAACAPARRRARSCGVRLRKDPAAYQRAHELPGWYPALAQWAPESVWTADGSREAFDAVRTALAARGRRGAAGLDEVAQALLA